MSLEIPDDSGEFVNINDPLELARTLQTRIFEIGNLDDKQKLANTTVLLLNRVWKFTDKHLVIGDSLIGPTKDPEDQAPFEHYKQVEGKSTGFSCEFAELDLGQDLYIMLTLWNVELVGEKKFEKTLRRLEFHAPVIEHPWFETFDVA